METLWAPWRIGYIMGEKPEGCIFCAKAAEGRDAENFILLRGEHCFAVLNIYPYNNGHLMVVPYAHLASLEDVPMPALMEMMAMTQRCLGALRRSMRPNGFNVGVNQGATAGAGVAEHVHMHVVPRWLGDTNFMPVLAETRVISQSLENCYAVLAAALAGDAPDSR